MKVNEVVNFPVQLVHVETVRINAEKKKELIHNELNISVEVEGTILDKKTGKSMITIQTGNDEFMIEITKVGIFKFDEDIKDEGEAKYFMEIQGIRILWSYVREDIYTISGRMLPRPIMLPTIDVLKTIKKAQEKHEN